MNSWHEHVNFTNVLLDGDPGIDCDDLLEVVNPERDGVPPVQAAHQLHDIILRVVKLVLDLEGELVFATVVQNNVEVEPLYFLGDLSVLVTLLQDGDEVELEVLRRHQARDGALQVGIRNASRHDALKAGDQQLVVELLVFHLFGDEVDVPSCSRRGACDSLFLRPLLLPHDHLEVLAQSHLTPPLVREARALLQEREGGARGTIGWGSHLRRSDHRV
mmetsp:Transcript_24186/g.37218  ORF Transcript_24186/g.37218 Transcript_24186/m.37218 type:complete len:218 (+) Transcript_24186:311-964(+)